MASKELTNEVAAFLRNISVSSDNGGSYDEYECKEKAEELLSIVLAALQEPTEEMLCATSWELENPKSHESRDHIKAILAAMLNASPLGEQSE